MSIDDELKDYYEFKQIIKDAGYLTPGYVKQGYYIVKDIIKPVSMNLLYKQ